MKPVWPISIWQPQTRDGDTVWVRPPPAAFGDHYASRPELTRKRAELPLRVVLFGESVAAGYLYAPRLTPAGVLEVQLQAYGGSNNFEVIDLARTNETLAGLRATVRASLQINPDVLVLFVGNNWNLLETPTHSAYAADPLARQAFGTTLRDKSLDGVQQAAWEPLRDIASAVFEEIALIARTVGIPLLLVIPEVNLADWENRQPVAWLPGDGVARWHLGYRAALAALERGDSAAAVEAAERMLAATALALAAATGAGGGSAGSGRRAPRARLSRGSASGIWRDFFRSRELSPKPQHVARCAAQRFTGCLPRHRPGERAGARTPGYVLAYVRLWSLTHESIGHSPMKHMLSSLLIIVVGIYLALCALLFLMQRQMLFLPQYTRVAAATTDFELVRDGITLRGWRVNPGQPQALLYFGGNAEEIGYQRERFARWFPDHTIYLLAYRGYGASEGSPGEAALKADALALYDQVAPAHGSVDVLGRSVGTGVALHVAARRPLGRLALITPYDSLVAVASHHYPFFPVNWILRERFEAVADAAQVGVPTLLLLARQDEVIPPAHGEALARAFPAAPVLQWLDSDHNTTEMDVNFALALQRHFRRID